VRRRDPDATVVIMSGEPDRSAALKAMSHGAFDFFRKQFDPAELLVVLRRALERRRLLVENRELREVAQAPVSGEDRIVGRARRSSGCCPTCAGSPTARRACCSSGESGSGKELVARAIHSGSPRRARAFVAVNAAALPESLAEAELFGHEKGAFTGAVSSRPGRFELAQGGTLLLDEIGTLSPAVQSKLLRALESREIERVGGRRPIAVDFRLVSATTRASRTASPPEPSARTSSIGSTPSSCGSRRCASVPTTCRCSRTTSWGGSRRATAAAARPCRPRSSRG
jgi:two-component system C4-dicarboxylate transport response regulator DctD